AALPVRARGEVAGTHTVPRPGRLQLLEGVPGGGPPPHRARPEAGRHQPEPDRGGTRCPGPGLRGDPVPVRGGLRPRGPRPGGGRRPAPPQPPRPPGGPVHLPLPGRAGAAAPLPDARAAHGHRRGLHDVALSPRPDDPADDRRAGRHRRLRRRQVPGAVGGAQPRLPRPLQPLHLPRPQGGPPGAARRDPGRDAVPLPEVSLKDGFSRFFAAASERLHFAAHSHHPWPDVSFDGHQRAWIDATRLADDKWGPVFGELIPRVAGRIAGIIGVEGPESIAFGPNTHSFLLRLFSCFEPPVRILSTDGEFHSFVRQTRRWEEAGLAVVDRVPVEPFETFAERFTAEARSGSHDLVYLSQVFFDSGFVVPG